jgi:ribonuclease III
VSYRSTDSNERLEFLGDSIVNAVVAEYLYNQYPDRAEGDLAKGRALVVSKVSLYEAGVRLGLPDLIVVGANAEGMFARSRRSMTADALEALLAVIYLQRGWETVRTFILRILAPELDAVRDRTDLRDAKTILQERAQAKRLPGPVYRTVSEEGDPHNRVFTCEVILYDGTTATGTGRSKKDAQQVAAAAALGLIDGAN